MHHKPQTYHTAACLATRHLQTTSAYDWPTVNIHQSTDVRKSLLFRRLVAAQVVGRTDTEEGTAGAKNRRSPTPEFVGFTETSPLVGARRHSPLSTAANSQLETAPLAASAPEHLRLRRGRPPFPARGGAPKCHPSDPNGDQTEGKPHSMKPSVFKVSASPRDSSHASMTFKHIKWFKATMK